MQPRPKRLRQKKVKLIADHEMIEKEKFRYPDLFEFAPEAYLVTDSRGFILEANCQAESLFSVQRKQLKGKSLSTFWAAKDRKLFRTILSRLKSLKGRETREISRLFPDLQELGTRHPWCQDLKKIFNLGNVPLPIFA